MRTFRLVVAVVAVGVVGLSLVAAFTTGEDSFRDVAPFTAFVLLLVAVPFALYVLFVSSEAASIITGVLLFVPTAGVFAWAGNVTRNGDGGGAGGPILWIGLPTIALAYVVVTIAITADRSLRRRA